MRIAPFILLAAVALVASGHGASAIEYPWCAEYGGGFGGGGTNCGFSTIEQCRAAISGNGGYCRENLFYRGPVAEAAVAPRRHAKRVRRYR